MPHIALHLWHIMAFRTETDLACLAYCNQAQPGRQRDNIGSHHMANVRIAFDEVTQVPVSFDETDSESGTQDWV